MLALFGLIGCLIGGAVWKAQDNAHMSEVNKKAAEFYNETQKRKEEERKCDEDRQKEIYLKLRISHCYPDGTWCKEHIHHEKETMRVVKRLLEEEGILYYNHGMWNLDGCEFDDDGRLLKLNGKKIFRVTDFM